MLWKWTLIVDGEDVEDGIEEGAESNALSAAMEAERRWSERSARRKRPRDFSQAAKLVIDVATGQAEQPAPPIRTPAQEFASKGGLAGGKARAAKLSSKRRSEIAAKAAKSRWAKKRTEQVD